MPHGQFGLVTHHWYRKLVSIIHARWTTNEVTISSTAHLKPSMNNKRRKPWIVFDDADLQVYLIKHQNKNLDLHCQEIFIILQNTTMECHSIPIGKASQIKAFSKGWQNNPFTIFEFSEKPTNINNQHSLKCTLVQHSVNNITQSIHYCRTGNHHRWHSAIWKNKITCKQVVTWN